MLAEIVAYKKEETRQKEAALSLSGVKDRIEVARRVRDFEAPLRRHSPAIIAEAKYRSPSKGILRADFAPVDLCRSYQRGGAVALSVLADSRFFGGGPFVVAQVAADAEQNLPVLYKDFVVTPYQLFEARACGADAVLFIVRVLPSPLLGELFAIAQDLGMAALFETFDESDIDAALEAGARIVGINNRDLKSFEVDLERSARLVKLLGRGVTAVAESGISERAQLVRLAQVGFHAALIGESLVTAPHPEQRLREFNGI